MKVLHKSVSNLQNYIKAEKYKGFDPYDALNSPLFKIPFLNTNKIIRLGTQQVIRRLPINIRQILGIRKSINPVTIGLVIPAYSYVAQLDHTNTRIYEEVNFLLDVLEKTSSKGYSGICWGYDFDWEAKYAKIPAYTPTIVATGIITNGLFESYKLLKIERMFEMCKSACEFINKDLNRYYEGSTFCWSYSPYDNQKVINATLKGARLFSQVYSIEKTYFDLLEQARQTVQFSLNSQNSDGSWSYSKGDSREWVDNFHTGYVLDCLREYKENSRDQSTEIPIKIGLSYYINSFFKDYIIPKYYNNSLYPIDSTAIAQSIITLANFNHIEIAKDVAQWSIKNMQDKNGYFYYQRRRFFTNKISYMRWSNAWMFNALAKLLYIVEK